MGKKGERKWAPGDQSQAGKRPNPRKQCINPAKLLMQKVSHNQATNASTGRNEQQERLSYLSFSCDINLT